MYPFAFLVFRMNICSWYLNTDKWNLSWTYQITYIRVHVWAKYVRFEGGETSHVFINPKLKRWNLIQHLFLSIFHTVKWKRRFFVSRLLPSHISSVKIKIRNGIYIYILNDGSTRQKYDWNAHFVRINTFMWTTHPAEKKKSTRHRFIYTTYINVFLSNWKKNCHNISPYISSTFLKQWFAQFG